MKAYIMMNDAMKAKSFDLMVATLIGLGEKQFMAKQSDMTAFTESVLLKGYKIVGKRRHEAILADVA